MLRRSVVSDSLRPHHCSPPGSSGHGSPPARILEGVPLPPQGIFPDKPTSLTSPALVGRFFTTSITWEALSSVEEIITKVPTCSLFGLYPSIGEFRKFLLYAPSHFGKSLFGGGGIWESCSMFIVFHFSFCLIYKGFCLWSQTFEQRMHKTKEAWWVCFTFLMRNWSHIYWKLLKLDSWIIWRGELVEFQFKELLTGNSFLHQFLHFYLSRILGSLLCSFQCPWCTWHIKVGWILQSLGIRISLECSKLYWERFCVYVSFFSSLWNSPVPRTVLVTNWVTNSRNLDHQILGSCVI